MTTRVVQWATGAMGRTILRRMIEHPDLDVVGALVYDPAKAGRDIGSIARLHDVGVTATADPEAILSLDADVVVHAARLQAPYTHHDDDLMRMLESGKNVITINGHSAPGWWGSERLAGFAAAGRTGASTLMAAGLNPGFALEQLAVTATGLCTTVESIQVSEVVDTTMMTDPSYVFGLLGFGSDPGVIDPNADGWAPAELLGPMFTEVLATAASRLGVKLDRVETAHRMFGATRDLEVGAGPIAAGSVARTCWRWNGILADRTFVSLSIEWTMEPDVSGAHERPTWHVEVRGEPDVTIDVEIRKPSGDPRRTTAEQYALAGAVLNAIPAVLDAAPGVAATPLSTPWQRPSTGT